MSFGPPPRVAISAIISFALFIAGATAHADTSHRARLVYLRGIGTETCPVEADLRDAVAARLGYDPFSSWAEDTLFVELTKEVAGGFSARVKLVDTSSNVRGERELHARGDCSDLTSTMALTISLAIDPMAGADKPPPDDAPPREKPVDLSPAPPSDDVPKKTVDQATTDPANGADDARARWALGASALAAIGNAPAVNAGFALFGEGRYKWASLGLEARIDVPSATDVDPSLLTPRTTGVNVSSWLYAGELRACAHYRGFFGCGLGVAGQIRATALDVATSHDTGALYGAVGGRLGYEYPLTPALALRGQVEADAVLTRYALEIGSTEVYRFSPAAGNLALSVVFHIQ